MEESEIGKSKIMEELEIGGSPDMAKLPDFSGSPTVLLYAFPHR